MEANLQRRVQRFGWDRASDYYENGWQQQLKPAHDGLLELANVGKGERVLDIAAGTGLVSYRLADQVGASGTVLGTDISDEMVKKASQIAIKRDISNISFQRTGAEELEVGYGTYDLVVCALGLMYVPEVDTAFDEMFRVLKTGGRTAVAVWGQRKNCGWADIFPIVDSRVKSDVCPLFFQLGTGEILKEEFENAGFNNIEVRRIQTLLVYNNQHDACEAAFLGGPVALAYARFDESTRAAARADYIKSIEPYQTETGYAIPGEFVVAVGYKS